MNCPYCWSSIHDRAIVCPHCTRDLAPIRPLLDRICALEERVGALEAGGALLGLGQHQALADLADPAPVKFHVRRLALCALAAWSCLLLAHWLLLFVYDAPVIVLRVVTLVIPLVAAGAMNLAGDVDWRGNLVAAVLLGVSAVVGMLGVTAAIDHVAWFPETLRDWRETLEYAVSILLAWVSGHLIGVAITRRARQMAMHRVMLRQAVGAKIRFDEVSDRIQRLIAQMSPLVSGAVALYTGLRSLQGG